MLATYFFWVVYEGIGAVQGIRGYFRKFNLFKTILLIFGSAETLILSLTLTNKTQHILRKNKLEREEWKGESWVEREEKERKASHANRIFTSSLHPSGNFWILGEIITQQLTWIHILPSIRISIFEEYQRGSRMGRAWLACGF